MANGAEDSRLTAEQTEQVLAIGRSAPRQRRQDGHVRKEGKRSVRWKGHYFEYETMPNGTEVRHHRKVDLGPVTDSTKKAAKDKLRGEIAKALNIVLPPEPDMTLRRFWEERYRPLREPTWKASSRDRAIFNLDRYVVTPFENVPLVKLTKFDIQMHLNRIAGEFSFSVVQKFRTHIKAILEEAIEQDLLIKNPARKLTIPQTRETCNRFLSQEEITDLFKYAPTRDRLILRMFVILGLRPGELFALRRDDVSEHQVRIDESASWTKSTVRPKNAASRACVWLPDKLAVDLAVWTEAMKDHRPEAFVFASSNGTPIDHHNFLNRNIKSIVAAALKARSKANIETPEGYLVGVNHQSLRRTCATYLQESGNVKDAQSHLRHSSPMMTAGTYMQPIEASVRRAVEALEEKFR